MPPGGRTDGRTESHLWRFDAKCHRSAIASAASSCLLKTLLVNRLSVPLASSHHLPLSPLTSSSSSIISLTLLTLHFHFMHILLAEQLLFAAVSFPIRLLPQLVSFLPFLPSSGFIFHFDLGFFCLDKLRSLSVSVCAYPYALFEVNESLQEQHSL